MRTTLSTQNLRTQALPMYSEAIFRSKLRSVWANLSGKYNRLLDLDDTVKNSSKTSRHYAGIRSVDLQRIRGTQSKANEFDAEFNPLTERSRDRWLGIAIESLRGRNLPPVTLIQIGSVFYVQDGHHRISVAKSLGQKFIDAEVTVVRVM